MKPGSILALLPMLLFALAACGGDGDQDTPVAGSDAGARIATALAQRPTPSPTSALQRSPSPTSRGSSTFQMDLEGRPSIGPETAPVTIVEFADYQCPFCGRHSREVLPRVLSEYEGEIRYVVVNFPIPRIHPLAPRAAEAAECAHDQGRFWDYHDLLFENQEALELTDLKGYATQVGLDAEAFDACLEGGVHAQKVQQDLQDGFRNGIDSIPTFFINGRRLVGAQPFEGFKAMIDQALGR